MPRYPPSAISALMVTSAVMALSFVIVCEECRYWSYQGFVSVSLMPQATLRPRRISSTSRRALPRITG